MPLFSVIMRTWNRAPYLAEAIESVLNQTCKDFELIVCDDGSTDSTPKLMDHYLQKDKRIVYLQKPHTGIADTGNYAISRSKGKLIAQADSDDIQEPQKLEIYKKAFTKGIDFVYTGYYHCNIKGEIWNEVHPKEFTLENIKKNEACAGEAITYRREVWEKTPYRKEMKINDDLGFSYDLFKAGYNWKLVDLPTFRYRLLPSSTSYARKNEVNESTKEFWRQNGDSLEGLRLP